MINDRYHIENKLGEGRSSVYLCKDEQSQGKLVAFKNIPLTISSDEKETFINEYRLLRRLEHPNIIKVVDSGIVLDKEGEDCIQEGSSFFTLEYFNGSNALSLAGCSENILVSFIEKLGSAIFYLHQSRLIYYDIKAENILVNIINDTLELRLIDFGLTHYNIIPPPDHVRGSAEYIAPELLKKEKHDHRADLYSLGILLYRIVYNRFPFNTGNEFDIFREHLETTFEFPASDYSPKIILVIKRLLEKDPNKRYSNTLEIMLDLKSSVQSDIISTWYPAQIFSNRNDALSIVNKYINDKTSSDIFIIKGSDDSGKTSLLLKINELNDNSVFISYNKSISGVRFIRLFLRRLLYTEKIFKNTDPDLITKIKTLLHSSADNIFEEVKSIISVLLIEVDFILLFDNFNEADEYVLDFFRNIFPVFQVNNKKLIFTENSDLDSPEISLFNTREINLNPFTEAHLSEYLLNSYADFFPVDDLKKLILMYADLLPGNIVQFIKDILILNIVQYTSEGIKVNLDEQSSDIIFNSHEEIYRVRISNLEEEELQAAWMFSAIDVPLDQVTASILLNTKFSNAEKIINTLQVKSIIQSLYNRNLISISSEGLKKFLYKSIKNKYSIHADIASIIEQRLTSFNRVELARQFILSGNFENGYKYTYEEVSELLNIAAYSYARTLLIKMLDLPLDKTKLIRVKRDLASVMFNLSDFKEALQNLHYLEAEGAATINDLVLKASCIIGSGEYESGKNLLISLLPEINNDDERRRLFVEIANAHYELNNYQEASEICQLLIENPEAHLSELGKCYSILALINIFMDGDMNKASSYFERAVNLYSEAGIHFRAAQMEMNLGNVYNMKGDHDKAEESWNKSLKVITSIGNLELEGKLLINYGVYHFDKLHFEEATSYYNRALSIFSSLGNLSGEASVYYNIAEVYLITCEYEKAIDALNSSVKLFNRLKNLNAELDSLFMLGKTYYIIGDYRQLELITEITKSKLYDDKVVEKSRRNYEVLDHLKNINSLSPSKISSLKELSGYYLDQDDRYNYMFVTFMVGDILFRTGKFEEMLMELTSEKLVQVCSENQLCEMERQYWLGILARKGCTEHTSIEYFITASDYFLKTSVVELSWKVFFNLAEEYYNRGNTGKAEEFYYNAKSVLEYIFNVSSGDVRDVLIHEPVRKYAFDKLKIID